MEMVFLQCHQQLDIANRSTMPCYGKKLMKKSDRIIFLYARKHHVGWPPGDHKYVNPNPNPGTNGLMPPLKDRVYYFRWKRLQEHTYPLFMVER